MISTDLLDYFKMEYAPFTNNIDTGFLYQTDIFRGACLKLNMAIENNSFALLTGVPGTGKSTLLRYFTSQLNEEKHTVMYVSLSNATPRWMYIAPLNQMGVKSKYYVNDARLQLHREIETLRKTHGKKVILIFDEAHLLANKYSKFSLLEEIRFLLNGNSYDSGSPLTLILSGQKEILSVLKTDKCKAITQRIMYFSSTQNLTNEQVGSYIGSHLKWSRCPDNPFEYRAVEKIGDLSGGNPRLINKICMHALSYTCLKREEKVTEATVTEVANNEVIDLILKNLN